MRTRTLAALVLLALATGCTTAGPLLPAAADAEGPRWSAGFMGSGH